MCKCNELPWKLIVEGQVLESKELDDENENADNSFNAAGSFLLPWGGGRNKSTGSHRLYRN